MTADQRARWNNVVYQVNRACSDPDFLALFTSEEGQALFRTYDALKRIMRDAPKDDA